MTLKELGETIREKRENCGLSIDEVASRIKVSARILRAIENGSKHQLPHAVYSKGFIRSFAALVGYEQTELNAALDEIFPADELEDTPPPLSKPLIHSVSRQEMIKRFSAVLAFLCFIGLIIWGGWFISVHYGKNIFEFITRPFSAATADDTYKAKNELIMQLEADSIDSIQQEETTVNEEKHRSEPGQTQNTPVHAASQEASAAEESAVFFSKNATKQIPKSFEASKPPNNSLKTEQGLDPEETAALAEDKYVVHIQAYEDCYLGITADNKKLIHHMLKAKESWTVVFSHSLKLLVGNAGGISIRYNGKDMGLLGAKAKPRLFLFPL